MSEAGRLAIVLSTYNVPLLLKSNKNFHVRAGLGRRPQGCVVPPHREALLLRLLSLLPVCPSYCLACGC